MYYGTRLGVHVPWYTGFPFNVVSHPQYVGSVLTIWGVFALTLTQAHLSAGYAVICVVWSLYYVITGYIEEFQTEDANAVKNSMATKKRMQ